MMIQEVQPHSATKVVGMGSLDFVLQLFRVAKYVVLIMLCKHHSPH